MIFRERGKEGEGEREGEEHQRVVASCMPPTGGLACNPCMCIDWESNWWPFSSQAGTQSTKPHQPGRPSSLYILEPNSCLRYHLQIYFPLYWFPFHFAIFFSCAEAFYFDKVPFVYSFLYAPCSREYINILTYIVCIHVCMFLCDQCWAITFELVMTLDLCTH